MTMDPLCEKYYHISPYAYCAGNPVNLVDPDGNMLVIIYENNGKMDYFYFTGIETVIPDDDYVRSVIEAYKYNKENWLNAGNPGDSPAIKDKDYANQEEKRVITGSEQLSAFANGEIKRGQVTRTNHRGKTVLTVGATSNIIDDYATTYYEKKKH